MGTMHYLVLGLLLPTLHYNIIPSTILHHTTPVHRHPFIHHTGIHPHRHRQTGIYIQTYEYIHISACMHAENATTTQTNLHIPQLLNAPLPPQRSLYPETLPHHIIPNPRSNPIPHNYTSDRAAHSSILSSNRPRKASLPIDRSRWRRRSEYKHRRSPIPIRLPV